jgi:hypothetical protein
VERREKSERAEDITTVSMTDFSVVASLGCPVGVCVKDGALSHPPCSFFPPQDLHHLGPMLLLTYVVS